MLIARNDELLFFRYFSAIFISSLENFLLRAWVQFINESCGKYWGGGVVVEVFPHILDISSLSDT